MTSMLDGDRDGTTYEHDVDYQRLNDQMRRVFDAICDRQWHSLSELSATTGDPEASVSARLRDLRKVKFGGWRIESERFSGGWFRYRLAGKNELAEVEQVVRRNSLRFRVAAAEQTVDAVKQLAQRARAISSGARAVVYVADLEAALGIAPDVHPHKLGQSGDE